MTIGRVVMIVLDSVGVGALPDAAVYGDEGSNTLQHLDLAVGGLNIPNLAGLGLGRIVPLKCGAGDPLAAYGRAREKAAGKDTTTGHWELAGVVLDKPFPVYPEGFPVAVIEAFSARIGRGVLGNVVASGTEIIEELGVEHIRTGWPIVYTSADSVFQVAAHEGVISVEELYTICRMARELLQSPHGVGRVIARPFTGSPGRFQRTANRRDFSLPPPGITLLDRVIAAGLVVYAVGKIADIFAGRGVSVSIHTSDNMDGVDKTIAAMREAGQGLIFANLVDFDSKYGHRNDPEGYAAALEAFDARLEEIMAALRADDILVITADHGCDPTTASTDHSREYIPVLVYGRPIKPVALGERETFADVGATVADLLGCQPLAHGRSVAPLCYHAR